MFKQDFVHVETPEPHRGRTREMLKQHPEMRQLIGKNPYSFLAILGVVGFQVGMAVLLSGQSWCPG